MAAETGIDSSNIRSYESGRAMPSVFTLVRIADALGVTPGSLIDGLTVDLFPAESARRIG
ncbi:helix-turn-helix domain-containing protein [Microbacterium aurum]|nr:helix-turn-helix domain-containing protein [Microbacterium aurum]